MSIMLQDSAHIQESDAEYKNRKNRRAGRPEEEPLYTVADALASVLETAGAVAAIVVSLPLFRAVWDLLESLL